jgi:hypothetical protein
MSLKSVFDRTVGLFRSSGSGGGDKKNAPGATAQQHEYIFPKVNPAEDGADCFEDCASCPVAYPRLFRINEEHDLYGQVKAWATHVLVATGKADWTRDIGAEKGSVLEALAKGPQPRNGVG